MKIIIHKYFCTLTAMLFMMPSFGQKINITVKDSIAFVPFVTISDSTGSIIGFTNAKGQLTFSGKVHKIIFSHVSFLKDSIEFDSKNKDTSFTFTLKENRYILNPIIATNYKLNKKKVYSLGYYNNKVNSGLILRLQTMLGIKIYNNSLDRSSKYIRSVNFELMSGQTFSNRKFTIEIKLYEILANGEISDDPINYKPIYISSDDLGKKNIIFIKERIPVPDNGVFISVELPEAFDSDYSWTLNFAGRLIEEKGSVYVTKNINGKWDPNVLKHSLPVNSSFLQLNFGLTYLKLQKHP